MTILTSIILIVAIVAMALFIGYNVQRGTKALKEFKTDFDNNEQAQELVELSKQLYDKDLRPIVTYKAPKQEKVVAQELNVVEPEFVEKKAALAKLLTKTQTTTSEQAKLVKKKKKYYPKNN